VDRNILNETRATLPRILIVWNWIPCFHLGAGILMRRLFAGYPPDRLWALTSNQSKRDSAPFDPLPRPEHQLSVPEIQIHRRLIHRLALLLNYMLIPWTVWRGVKLVREQNINAIFTVPWDQYTVAAYFIHRFTGRPLYMYAMDDPVGTRRFAGLRPVVYALLMPRVARGCKRLWGVSDGMCEYFQQAYTVKCLPLLPLLELAEFKGKNVRRSDRADGSFQVIYTGSIYSAQLDAVRRLVHVVDQETSNNNGTPASMRLTLYTSVSSAALEKMGLSGKNVRRSEVRHEDVARVLAEADVVFLPLSFEPGMRHIVETSFPSKIAEYLAAGVPILVHAPAYSAAARYCRDQECALVVDQPDEAALRDGLMRLRDDAALRRALSAKGLEVAAKNHDARRIAPAFLEQMC
jgi:glycosyltransferase involved in cell wall biosynthesis